MWLVERDRPAVRFHAMQSMLAFGATFLAWATLWGGSFAVLVVSASGFFLLQRLAQLVLLAGFIVWAVCLWQVSRGVEFRLPFFGGLAERLAPTQPDPTRPNLAHPVDYISPFQSSGSGATDRKISMCHLPPPHGSMISVAMTSTRISEKARPSGSPSR